MSEFDAASTTDDVLESLSSFSLSNWQRSLRFGILRC